MYATKSMSILDSCLCNVREGAGESVPAVSEEEKLRAGDDGASLPTHKPGGGKKGKKDRKKKALEEVW